jgi:hypothetical protein
MSAAIPGGFALPPPGIAALILGLADYPSRLTLPHHAASFSCANVSKQSLERLESQALRALRMK